MASTQPRKGRRPAVWQSWASFVITPAWPTTPAGRRKPLALMSEKPEGNSARDFSGHFLGSSGCTTPLPELSDGYELNQSDPADSLHYDCIVISDLHLGSDVCQAKLLEEYRGLGRRAWCN